MSVSKIKKIEQSQLSSTRFETECISHLSNVIRITNHSKTFLQAWPKLCNPNQAWRTKAFENHSKVSFYTISTLQYIKTPYHWIFAPKVSIRIFFGYQVFYFKVVINTIFSMQSFAILPCFAHQLFADATRISLCMSQCWRKPTNGIPRPHTNCLLRYYEPQSQNEDPSCQSTLEVLHQLRKRKINFTIFYLNSRILPKCSRPRDMRCFHRLLWSSISSMLPPTIDITRLQCRSMFSGHSEFLSNVGKNVWAPA